MDKSRLHKSISKKDLNELVVLLADQNTEAFCEIYLRFFNPMLLFGRQICSHTELVEDVVQEFFIWLLEHGNEVKHVSNFEIYAFKSLRRNIYTRLNVNRQRAKSQKRYSERTQFMIESNRMNVEEQLVASEIASAKEYLLAHELDRLPTRLKEVLFLRYYQDYSYDEISEILGISNQIARNYVSRAFKKLRERTHNLDYRKIIGLVMCILIGI